MKKGMLVGLLSVVFLLVLTASVFANNGPHLGGAAPGSTDGGFVQDTDACAGCHRAHTGVQVKLLKSGTNVFSFCTSCHDGQGANTNVLSGLFEGDADIIYDGHNSKTDGVALMGLNGGGFEQAVGYTGRTNRNPDTDPLTPGYENYGNVASRHKIEGLDGAGPFVAFGGGDTGRGVSGSGGAGETLFGGSQLTLKCTSCHDPHGAKNMGGSERYRILVNRVVRYDGALPIDVTNVIESSEGATKDYTKIQYKKNADNSSGISSFCAACHTQYKTPSSVYDANDTNGNVMRFRHAIDGQLSLGDLTTGNQKTIAENLTNHTELPGEQSTYGAISGTDKLVCLTCHQSHGTKATTSASSTVGPANSSTLLRLNNRGVCQDCHQR